MELSPGAHATADAAPEKPNDVNATKTKADFFLIVHNEPLWVVVGFILSHQPLIYFFTRLITKIFIIVINNLVKIKTLQQYGFRMYCRRIISMLTDKYMA